MAEPAEPRQRTVQVLIDGQPHELTFVAVSLELFGAAHTTVNVVNEATPAAPPDPPTRPIPPAGTRVRELSRSGRAGYSMGPDPDRPGHLLVDWDVQSSTQPDSIHVSKVNVLPAVS